MDQLTHCCFFTIASYSPETKRMKMPFLVLTAGAVLLGQTAFGQSNDDIDCLLESVQSVAACASAHPDRFFNEDECRNYATCIFTANVEACDCLYDRQTQLQQWNECRSNALLRRNEMIANCVDLECLESGHIGN